MLVPLKKTSTFAIHCHGMARAENASDKHNDICHMDGYQTSHYWSSKMVVPFCLPTRHGTYWHHKLPTYYSFLWNGHRTNFDSCLYYYLARHFIVSPIVAWITLVLHGNLARFCFEFECKYFVSLVLCAFCEDTFGTYWFVPFHRSAEVLQKQKCLVGWSCQEMNPTLAHSFC